MKEFKDYAKWTLNNTLTIFICYVISIVVLLIIHGLFGFTMNDEGTYLSNTLMHTGSGVVLALGTGIVQKELLKKHLHVSFFWVLSLIIGFVLAELIAGLVLWKLEIYRGLINLFNSTNHFPEASIFALAGLISGILQSVILKAYRKKRYYWIVSSSLGWGLLILSTYLGIFAFLLGALFYGLLTGFVLFRILELKPQNNNLA